MNVNKFIIITSINKPNKATYLFSNWKDWKLVVVGDRKSPVGWKYPRVKYLSIEDQYALFGDLAKLIPENTYARKIFGYIYAIQHGAEVIFETDDDNIPYSFAQGELQKTIANNSKMGPLLSKKGGWVNIYREFGKNDCWPRGYPIEMLNFDVNNKKENCKYSAKIIQYLTDLDPDVDAIFRITNGRTVYFKKNLKFALKKGNYCPFNSQATLWFKEAFPLMFFPLGVSDRVTDILRGFVAQTCLWFENNTVEFRSPIVYQKRNAHDLLKDFYQENMLYLNSDRWSKIFCSNLRSRTLTDSFVSALELLIEKKFISANNLNGYSSFIDSINFHK